MVSGVFILGLAALLFAPGPTNTLLCAAGATGGLRAAPRLLGAEALAYAVSVMALGLALQPLIAWEPRLAVALQGAAALFLLKAAWSLWQGGARLAAPAAVSARMVGVATLLNPKGLVIAFGLMPEGWSGDPAMALAHLAALMAMTPLIGGAWMLAGRLGAAAAGPAAARAAPRVSAVALLVFAALLARSAMAG